MFALLTTFAFFVYKLTSINGQVPTNGIAWESGDYPLPQRVYLAPAFSINDNIAYIFDVRNDPPTVYKLDTTISNPSWQELPVTIPMTSTNHAPWQRDQATKVGTKFYFYRINDRNFDVFDPETDTFIDNTNIAVSPNPTSGSLHALSDDNNYIYLVGGQHNTNGEYTQKYDISNNQWTVISTESPTGEEWFWLQTAYYPTLNRIYVFGGYTRADPIGPFAEYYYFDLSTNLWSNALGTWTSTPDHLGYAIYIPNTDEIYVFNMNGNEVKVYNPIDDSFSTTTNTPCVYGTWPSYITLNGRLQRFGGTGNGNNCRTDELYSIINPTVADTVDLVRFTQNSQYMEYDTILGLVMKANDDNLDYFLDSTFNKIEALNGADNCYSFQSIHYTDQYIGNNLINNDVSVLLYDGSNGDRVTWCEVSALNGNGGKSWVPFGYSSYYLRKNSQTNVIFVAENDNSVGFDDEVSFHMWQFDPIPF